MSGLLPRTATRSSLILCYVALSVVGCNRSEPPPARARDEIFREETALPAVYMTGKSRKRVIAPRSRGAFVDEQTGELCWPALACQRPECPGRGSDGEPYLFISPDPAMYAKPDGTIGVDPTRTGDGGPESRGLCPKCWEERNPDAETEEQRQQFVNWVKPYELPETKERLKELEAERQRRLRRDRYRDIVNQPADEEKED